MSTAIYAKPGCRDEYGNEFSLMDQVTNMMPDEIFAIVVTRDLRHPRQRKIERQHGKQPRQSLVRHEASRADAEHYCQCFNRWARFSGVRASFTKVY